MLTRKCAGKHIKLSGGKSQQLSLNLFHLKRNHNPRFNVAISKIDKDISHL